MEQLALDGSSIYLLKYCRKLALATEFYFGRNAPIFASQKTVKLANSITYSNIAASYACSSSFTLVAMLPFLLRKKQ